MILFLGSPYTKIMRMMVKHATRKRALGWAKESKRRFYSTMTTAPNAWKDNKSSQILLSPPLVSLDVPEIWGANSNHYDPSSGPKRSDVQLATIIDGKSIAEEIRLRIASEVQRMKEYMGKVPGLAVILVGQRKDSQTYVRNKIKACEEVGIKSVMAELPNCCAEEDIIAALLKFNEDPSVHGILVQLPLPERHHATVSIVHACTKNPEQITREADIVVTAAGVPNLVRGNWLKPGAVVIDVGTCPIEDPSSEYGYRLVGDVCYEEALRIASAVTPVPGGVGPMTIAMLLCNTLDSAKRVYGFA
ncbi:hypothetical protein DITRI_Ditri17bG0000200 [Diplodiscus trichospermus]